MNTTDNEAALARREREFHAQIAAHGGTGMPPDIAPVDAIRQGFCPLCGGHWIPIHRHMWKHFEPELRAQGITNNKELEERGTQLLRERFHVPDDAPRTSDEFRRILRESAQEVMSGPNGQQIKDQIAATLSRPRPDLYGKTGANPSGWNPSDWDIAKCLCSGMQQVETAKKLGGGDNHKLVGRRAESVGLALGASFLCDCGAPFRNGALFDLRRASGFEAADFDKIVGLSKGRSGDTHPAESLANPEAAGKVIEWRDDVIRALLKVSAESLRGLRIGDKTYRQDEVLRTFLPELPALNHALVGVKGAGTFGALRAKLRQNPDWTVKDLGEWICQQAAIEQSATGTDERWRKTLRYLASEESEKFLKDNLSRLRGAEDDGSLVREMIGSRYGASADTVQNALRGNPITGASGDGNRTEIIPSFEVGLLIRAFAPELAAPKPDPGGGQKGLMPATNERIRRMARLELARPRWTQEQMAPFVYWDAPATCQENIRPFSSRYRAQIEAAKKSVTKNDIEKTVQEAKKLLKK